MIRDRGEAFRANHDLTLAKQPKRPIRCERLYLVASRGTIPAGDDFRPFVHASSGPTGSGCVVSTAPKREWVRASKSHPCRVCNRYDERCAVSVDGQVWTCYRECGPGGQECQDSSGSVYWRHFAEPLGETRKPGRKAKPKLATKPADEPPIADADTRAAVYSTLLDGLSLIDADRIDLEDRRGFPKGLPLKIGYRTLPARLGARTAVLDALLKRFARETLLAVPGLFVGPSGLSLAAVPGLLIPIRDEAGRISSLVSRPNSKIDAGGKYLAVSSAKHGGPGPVTIAHLPVGTPDRPAIARIAEGQLKADLAFALSGLPTIGAPGVGGWKPAVAMATAIGAQTVRLAYDAPDLGLSNKKNVTCGLINLYTAARAEGLNVEIETWDGAAAKGIDDALAAGLETRVLSGDEVVPFLRIAAESAGVDPPADVAPPETSPTGDKPAIEITTDQHTVVYKAIEALARNPKVFCRGAMLVQVTTEPDMTARLYGGVTMRNAQGSARITPLAEPVVGMLLTESATFFNWRKDKSGEDIAVDCHPPKWLMSTIHALGEWPGIRPLVGVSECPFLRPDGSLVQTPGYDEATGVLYRPRIAFPPIPARPTREDARLAVERFMDPVRQIPFASDDDRSAFLAAGLTVAGRQTIPGPCPGYAVVANRAGTGKGLLIDVIGVAFHGFNVPTTDYPADAVEAAKCKVAVALSGKTVIHWDNVEQGTTYGNRALDSALTSTDVDERILGTSRQTGRTPLRCVFFLSGNNISPSADAYRRWLPINLVSDLERPEERGDLEITDLRSHVMGRRGELVVAALTVLRAYVVAGFPSHGKPALGSFEAWDQLVRGAVWYATGTDCCKTRRKSADEAPERADRLALLEGWQKLPNGGPDGAGYTAEDARKLVAESPEKYATLHAVMMRKSRNGDLPSARSIGNLIRGIKGVRIDGLTFEKSGEEHRSALWRVSGILQTTQSDDESGESTSLDESVSNPLNTGFPSDNYVKEYGESRNTYRDGSERHSSRLVDSPTGEREIYRP